MAEQNVPLTAFNRGEISRDALARIDIDRTRLSAERQENFDPAVLGPMMLRAGTRFAFATKVNNKAKGIPFVFANDDCALLEVTDSVLRISILSATGESLITRVSVATTVTNGDFSSGTGWTLTTAGTGSTATISGGFLTLAMPANGGTARAERTVAVSGGDTAKTHAFRIVVTRGPVIFKCGTTSGGDDVISETTLDTGTHSLAFIPGATTIYIRFDTISAQQKIVDSIQIEAAGTLELPVPWVLADLPLLRWEQSGDIVFVAKYGMQQRKIERRSSTSWSVVLYQSGDGPYQNDNITDITFTPSVLAGNGTLTASRSVFRTTHVGALIRLFSSGQKVSNSLAAQNTFTDPIRVTGVGASRQFSYVIAGTWVGTLSLQRSFDGPTSGFTDEGTTRTTNTAGLTINDGLDNSIVWYRWGFKTGNYTSGSADITLTYPGGGGVGICRITSFVSATVVNIEVLDPFASLDPTADWNFGDWSDQRGWPSAGHIYDGRLGWGGRDKTWLSESDAYYSYGIDTEGDSAAINRSLGAGPMDRVSWMVGGLRLLCGRPGDITSIRSTSLDEPLTRTNFSPKQCATNGARDIPALRLDNRAIYVEKSGRRVYELAFDIETQDYKPKDLTRMNTEIGKIGFVTSGIQRQPDTCLHYPRNDGVCARFLHDIEDEVDAWWKFISDGAGGIIEDVVVFPGEIEDRVYYCIKRTVNGGTVRYWETPARRDQCTGFPEARCADAHVVYSGLVSTTLTGLGHLEGQSVVVWVWNNSDDEGTDFQNADTTTKTFTVTGGQITIPTLYQNAVVGLYYEAFYQSSKLAYAAQQGTALAQKKQPLQVGLLLLNTHAKGIKYGQNFTKMDPLPIMDKGVARTGMIDIADQEMARIPGTWGTDQRLCLKAAAPRPCMVAAAVIRPATNG